VVFDGEVVLMNRSWTESQLREWLMEKGIVSPSSTREQLLVLAKQK
jgi:hypothetical protein